MATVVQGLAVSSGVAVGRAFLLHAQPLPIVPDPIPPERVNAEIDEFHRARAEAVRADPIEERRYDSTVLALQVVIGATLLVHAAGQLIIWYFDIPNAYFR